MPDVGRDDICTCGHKHRDHGMITGGCGWKTCFCTDYHELTALKDDVRLRAGCTGGDYQTVSQEMSMKLVMDAAAKYSPPPRNLPEGCNDPDCLICRPIGMDE